MQPSEGKYMYMYSHAVDLAHVDLPHRHRLVAVSTTVSTAAPSFIIFARATILCHRRAIGAAV